MKSLFSCLEVGSNLSGYNVVFSVNMPCFYTFHSDDA